jgi:hypothetical protein
MVRMFATLLRDAEMAVVRDGLDTLAALRSQTGLAPAEERRYQELCDEEWRLLRSGVTDR